MSDKLSRQSVGLTIKRLEFQIKLEVSFLFLENFLYNSNINIIFYEKEERILSSGFNYNS